MMNSFSKKEIHTKHLGERLAEIRERKGFSIEEAAKVTKINLKYLRYLEAGQYDKLPAEVYVRGFLKNYADFLSIREEDVLRIYDKEKKIFRNIKEKDRPSQPPNKIKLPVVILPLKLIISLLFGLFFIALAWYFYVEAGKFSETPRLLVYKPLNNSVIKNSSTEVSGVTDVGNTVSLNGKNIFVDENGKFRERVSLRVGLNELVIKAKNKFGKESEQKINVSARYDKQKYFKREQATLEKGENKPIDNKIRLTIRAQDSPVWLSVKVDGEKKYSGTMLPGTEENFVAEKEIKVTSGMANKTLIKEGDSQEFHPLADIPGVIRDVVFSRKITENIENDQPKERENSSKPDKQ